MCPCSSFLPSGHVEYLFLSKCAGANEKFMGCFCGFLPLITGLISSEAETQQERLPLIILTVFSTNLSLLYFPTHNDPRDRLFNM